MTRLLVKPRFDGLLSPVGLVAGDRLIHPVDETCRVLCCNCVLRATACPPTFQPPPGCPQPDVVEPIYVPCGATCASGAAIEAGTVFVYGDHCWTVEEGQVAPDDIPAGAAILDDAYHPECVTGGCADVRCPTEAQWVEGVPCDPDETRPAPWLLACELTMCIVGTPDVGKPGAGACWRFDPAASMTLEATPLNAIQLADMTLHADCCACVDAIGGPCNATAWSSRPCDQPRVDDLECCCSPDDAYELVSYVNETTDHRESADSSGNGAIHDFHQEWVIQSIGPTSASVLVRTTTQNQYIFGDGRDPVVEDPFVQENMTTLYFGGCPDGSVSDANYAQFFGDGVFSAPDVGVICQNGGDYTYNYPSGQGVESVTGTWRNTCTSSDVDFAGTIDVNEAAPDGSYFRQHATATLSWSTRRIQAPGPCANGCGSTAAAASQIYAALVGSHADRPAFGALL